MLERLRKKRQYAKEKYRIKLNECSQLLAESKSQPMVSPVSISIQKWINESCCAKIFMNKCLLCKDDSSDGKVCSVSDKFSRMCEKKDIFKMITEQNNDENEYFCCNSYPGTNETPGAASKVK